MQSLAELLARPAGARVTALHYDDGTLSVTFANGEAATLEAVPHGAFVDVVEAVRRGQRRSPRA